MGVWARPISLSVRFLTRPPRTTQVLESDGWTEKYRQEKFNLVVWTKMNKDVSPIDMIRMHCEFKGVTPETLYDVLHDADYRATWDDKMITGKVIEVRAVAVGLWSECEGGESA